MTELSMFGVLVGHLMGDFVFQNDFLAQGKKRDSCICGMHCMIYTAMVLVFSGWWMIPIVPGEPRASILLVLAIAVPHFLIDRWNFVPWLMRTMGQTKFMQPPMSPWSMIVVDSTLHLFCLLIVARLLACL